MNIQQEVAVTAGMVVTIVGQSSGREYVRSMTDENDTFNGVIDVVACFARKNCAVPCSLVIDGVTCVTDI